MQVGVLQHGIFTAGRLCSRSCRMKQLRGYKRVSFFPSFLLFSHFTTMVFLQAFLQSFFFSFLLVLPRFRTSKKVTKKDKVEHRKKLQKETKRDKKRWVRQGMFSNPVWSTLQLMLLWISVPCYGTPAPDRVNPNPQRLPNEA